MRYLPLADVMMISSTRLAVTTVLSFVFLKEACGAVEIINLLLTLSGVALAGARGQREVAGAAAHSLAPSHVLLAQRVVAVVRGAWRGNNICSYDLCS